MRRPATRRAREGRRRADQLLTRFGQALRLARVETGMTQRQLGALVGVTQPFVSLAERGLRRPDWTTACALAIAVGQDISIRMFPTRSVPLRDSGQLAAVELIVREAHPSWHPQLEYPVASGSSDLRAADLVLIGPDGVLHIEVERRLVDLQAQVRAANLKRAAILERLGRPVHLVLAVPGTRRQRALITRTRQILSVQFAASSQAAWRAIRTGSPLKTDAILYLPPGL